MRPHSVSFDVAVIGAGVTGLSTAWHLAHDATRILVLDKSGIGAEASGVQPGGVRQQWGTRINCELALESVAFYRDVGVNLGARTNPMLDQCGYLFVADDDSALTALAANVAVQNAAGVPSRIVGPVEAEELVPGLVADSVVGAAWCAEDGYFDKPQAVVEAFAAAAIRAGVEIRIGSVSSLHRDGGGWTLRLADGTTVTAHHVVVAAGCGAPDVVASLGLHLPIEKHAKYLFFSDPIHKRLFEPLVVAAGRHFAAKQLADGRVLASDLAAKGDPVTGREGWRRTVQAGAESLLPILEYVSYTQLVEGFYDVTPDHQPILGAVEGLDGVWLAAGFSGHGFMIAPAVGRRLSNAIRGLPTDPALEAFSLARFDRNDLARELLIV